MDLTRYVDNLRRELSVAAEAGGEEGRHLADRIVSQLSSAFQLTLLEALSDAAGEITREIAPGSVEIRLRGLDPGFVITLPPAEDSFEEEIDEKHVHGTTPDAPGQAATGESGATSRINFRPPEHLKTRIEEAAGKEQLSVNAWLVRAVSATLDSGAGGRPERRASRRAPGQVQRYTGWVK